MEILQKINKVIFRKTKLSQGIIDLINKYMVFAPLVNSEDLNLYNEAYIMKGLIHILRKKDRNWEPSDYWIPRNFKYTLFKVESRNPDWLKEQYDELLNRNVFQDNFFTDLEIQLYYRYQPISNQSIEIILPKFKFQLRNIKDLTWRGLFSIIEGIKDFKILLAMDYIYDKNTGEFLLNCHLY